MAFPGKKCFRDLRETRPATVPKFAAIGTKTEATISCMRHQVTDLVHDGHDIMLTCPTFGTVG